MLTIGSTAEIFHDGKLCRGVSATILARRAQGVKVSFVVDEKEVTVWCRRRRRSGSYEAIGYNYWLYDE